jgi:hypothetical protein
MSNTITNAFANVQLSSTITLAARGGVSGQSFQISDTGPIYYAAGTSSGQVDTTYSDTLNIASSGSPTTITLSSLTDEGGASIALAHVNEFVVTNLDPTNAITILPGATNPISWGQIPSAGVVIDPLGKFYFSSPGVGKSAVASTSDKIKFACAAGSPSFKITCHGRST